MSRGFSVCSLCRITSDNLSFLLIYPPMLAASLPQCPSRNASSRNAPSRKDPARLAPIPLSRAERGIFIFLLICIFLSHFCSNFSFPLAYMLLFSYLCARKWQITIIVTLSRLCYGAARAGTTKGVASTCSRSLCVTVSRCLAR